MSATSVADVHTALTAPGQLFEMENLVIRGIEMRAWKNAPANLAAILTASRAHGDLDFLVFEDERTTFEEHFRLAATVAQRLIEAGVGKGDRVVIAMRNLPEWSVAFWGAAAAGAVVVPLNAWWTGPELEYGIQDCGATVAFLDEQRHERLRAHLDACPDLATIVVAQTPSWDGFLGEVQGGDAALPAVADGLLPEDDATIFYTSGTTGRPKGALGTHRNICGNLISLVFSGARAAARKGASAEQLAASAGATPPASDAKTPARNSYLLSVPFFHATGCHSVLVANLAAGNKLVLMHKWDPGRALELIERERITTFGGVPAMVWQVLDHPDFASFDLSSVTSIGYGGAPAPPELLRRIEAMVPGRTPSNGYGLTETSSVTTMNVGVDYLAHPDSVGVPMPVVDVKLVDEDGADIPPGGDRTGELWIRGPNVVKGYWGKPEATADAFTDGWLHSGDVARIDGEGFVFIVDRAKDMLIRGGENVYCVEVESALFEHPAVSDAAVIGIPHEVLGEEVGAVVQIRHGESATQAELQRFVGERLAAFKVPSRIWFRDEPLPRNPAGKILKRDLREELLPTI